MQPDEKNARLEDLREAAAFAKRRFNALQKAFNTVEDAHKRGDYSRSSEFQQGLEEFNRAASEVHRLATELRSASDGRAAADPDQ